MQLRTDVIDIYYAHFDDESTPLEETVGAFEEARLAGRIRHVGLSNYTPERIRQRWHWPGCVIRPGVTAPLASARNLSQLRPILEALTLEVSVTRRPGLSPGSPMPRAPDPLWGRPAPTECACPERNGGCIRR